MNCPNCGAEVGEHAKFCSNCGQMLSDVVDTQVSLENTPTEPTVLLSEAVDPQADSSVQNDEKTNTPAESTPNEDAASAEVSVPDEDTAPTEVSVPDEDAAPTEVSVPDEDAVSTEATNILDETVVTDPSSDDTTAAETSLLEVQDDDTYIAADEAPTTIAGADPTVASEAEPTTFINDPDRINVFTSDDLDSTAISHFDPSQFTVVSSGPSSVERKQTKDGSDALRKVAFGLLAAVLVVGALAVAWVFQSHQDDAAKRSAVQQRIASYQEQIESVGVNPSSDSSRVELLNQYEKLDQIEEQITGDQKNGQFRLPNGTDDSGVNILNSSISDGQKRIRDWFEADYKRRLAANSFNDTDSATTLDLKSVSNRLVELQALLGDIEHEKEIWGNDTGANSTYDSYHSRVSDQIKKGESLKSGVTEKNKKEQEQKDKDKKSEEDRKKAQKWVGTYSGTGTDGKPMEVVIQKDGTVIWRIGGQPEVRGTWTGDENKLELSFNGQVSGKSEPFTLSSTNGGRTVSISSESSTWNTDTLSRK